MLSVLSHYRIIRKIGAGGMGKVYLAEDTRLNRKTEKSNYVLNYWIAAVYAAIGEKDAAFAELEKAYQAPDFFRIVNTFAREFPLIY